MPGFVEHINQAKRNLEFYQSMGHSSFFDWQVTVCYYTAVHLVNAHLAKMANLHYNTHKDTKIAISYENMISICRIDKERYLDYITLEKLSRRARYLSDFSKKSDRQNAFLTYDKHVAGAISLLNNLMLYFSNLYQLDFVKTNILHPGVKLELSKSHLDFFIV